ncbi:hypothetical protein EYC84_009675 [Monilinia fructicola]|uniref:Uncharacterized protein n=1 Tax=Monilinia fructicola TaxID=38448 RepID=A0A5M9JD75_MONFR|nr:hypothetical protein EYC84_009675 [Monilinia fructicola]
MNPYFTNQRDTWKDERKKHPEIQYPTAEDKNVLCIKDPPQDSQTFIHPASFTSIPILKLTTSGPRLRSYPPSAPASQP